MAYSPLPVAAGRKPGAEKSRENTSRVSSRVRHGRDAVSYG
ncbi:hypothetical protein [Streptomyces sp. CAU 1734]